MTYKNYLQEYPSDFPDAQAYGALLTNRQMTTQDRPMTEYTHYNPPRLVLRFRSVNP